VDAEQLRTLLAVAQREASPTSRPAVSRQLAALEQELGVRLFVPGSGRAELTPAGKAFLPVAQEFVAAVDRSGGAHA
jgi:DNA-binding transcriptional LysR family regulator